MCVKGGRLRIGASKKDCGKMWGGGGGVCGWLGGCGFPRFGLFGIEMQGGRKVGWEAKGYERGEMGCDGVKAYSEVL